MTLAGKFRVAVFDEFLDSFAWLPRAQQKKVNRFVRKFRSDPTHSSINYEGINTFLDPNLRTVRIDDAYRAVVLKPEKGNVYVLLWVDHHDDAMDWGARKRFVIHPETGSLQVLVGETEEVAPAPQPSRPTPPQPPPAAEPLFKGFSDDDLVSLGLPREQLEIVRGLVDSEELDGLAGTLPAEAYEALFFLADGESLESVRQALDLEAAGTVDTADFDAAFEKASTQRRFVFVDDDQALEAILEAPLEKWRVFLHPSQRKLVQAHFNGPARVLGGAGTGKTVVAMHRAHHLVTHVYPGDDDRILFTTFTQNLAHDIRENLRKLCTPAALRRIEVVHLDKWVSDFLRGQGYEYRIAYWPNEPLREAWETAIAARPADVSPQFLREEWEHVVQPEGCPRLEDYLVAKRTGRGVRLHRAQRKAIWPVFSEYRDLLEERGLRESLDAMRDAGALLERQHSGPLYRGVIVDEAQDMSTTAFALLRRIAGDERPNDLFIVGDGHQRIYRRKVVLRHAGVNIVGRSRRLYINYRTTDEIRRFAVALLEGQDVDDLDGAPEPSGRYKSLMHGELPAVRPFDSFREEADAIAQYVAGGEATHQCVVTRTNRLLEQYEEALAERGVETCRLRRSEADDSERPGVRLATMHRVKGLEFDRIVVASANAGIVPLDTADLRSDDPAVREDAELQERALLYVAVTRARRDVLITSHGSPSPWLTPP